jgi:hypothetical protein
LLCVLDAVIINEWTLSLSMVGEKKLHFCSSDLGFDVEKLQREVKTRWLKPAEVLDILKNHHLFKVEHKTPQKPPSNKTSLRFFASEISDPSLRVSCSSSEGG